MGDVPGGAYTDLAVALSVAIGWVSSQMTNRARTLRRELKALRAAVNGWKARDTAWVRWAFLVDHSEAASNKQCTIPAREELLGDAELSRLLALQDDDH